MTRILEPPSKLQKRIFAHQKNDNEILKAILSAIPAKTMKDTKHFLRCGSSGVSILLHGLYGLDISTLKKI